MKRKAHREYRTVPAVAGRSHGMEPSFVPGRANCNDTPEQKPAQAFVGGPLPGHYTPYTANVPLGQYEPCNWIVTAHQTLREAEAAIAKQEAEMTHAGTYNLKYRKHYATGSHQTARRTIQASDLPLAIAKLEADIAAHELNVTVHILEAHAKTATGWVQMIGNEADQCVPF